MLDDHLTPLPRYTTKPDYTTQPTHIIEPTEGTEDDLSVTAKTKIARDFVEKKINEQIKKINKP